ncbi:MAG: hypothetical protein NUV46_03310 [Nanoarchaeota archaeon]|nr:hypothetical protein [Nanoarchaeota archaeon]
MENEYIPKGTLKAGIDFNFKNYKIYAFPGREVSKEGRAEHLPYHCHIIFSGKEIRVTISETIYEIDGEKIPKDLQKYLEENKKDLNKKIKSVFHIGKI